MSVHGDVRIHCCKNLITFTTFVSRLQRKNVKEQANLSTKPSALTIQFLKINNITISFFRDNQDLS